MGSQYEGDPNFFPTDYTIPDDSDPPTAAVVNIGLEALGDRTAFLKTHVDSMALSWLHRATSLGDLRFAFYDPSGAAWVAGGDTRSLVASRDAGLTWSTGLLSLVGGASDDLTDGDANGAGDVVIASLSTDVFVGSGTSWSRKTLHSSGEDASGAAVVYDPDHGSWCAMACFSADGLQIATATSASGSWTIQTPPTGVGSAPFQVAAGVNKSGRIILATYDTDDEAICISHSDDGGVTWSAAQSIASGFAYKPRLKLSVSFNEQTGAWLIVASQTEEAPETPAALSVVFCSTNGGDNWTKMADLPSDAIGHPAPYGAGWVATAASASKTVQIVFSDSNGASWKRSGMRVTGDYGRGVYAGGGGLLAVSDEYAYSSLRTGDPDLGTLT